MYHDCKVTQHNNNNNFLVLPILKNTIIITLCLRGSG